MKSVGLENFSSVSNSPSRKSAVSERDPQAVPKQIDDGGDGSVDEFSACCSWDDEEDFGITDEDDINGMDDEFQRLLPVHRLVGIERELHLTIPDGISVHEPVDG